MPGIILGGGTGKDPKDRNEFPLGPYKVDIDYEAPQIRQKAATAQVIATTEVVETETGGAAPLYVGTVTSYFTGSKLGTISPLTGGPDGFFYNATGHPLNMGDTVTYAIIPGISRLVAISIYARITEYKPIEWQPPQVLEGFPYDGSTTVQQQNYDLEIQGNTNFNGVYSNITRPACVIGFYAEGSALDPVLGYAGRIVVMLGGNDRVAQPSITIHNVETGGTTNLSRIAAVGASNRTKALAVLDADKLIVTYDGTTGNCVEQWDSSTGTWTTYGINRAVFAGISDNKAWWLGYVSGGTRYQIISLDNVGVVTAIDYPVNITYSTTVGLATTNAAFAKAANGQFWGSLMTTSVANNVIVTGSTNVVGAASMTLSFAASPHSSTTTVPSTSYLNYQAEQFIYSRIAAAGATQYNELNSAESCADVDHEGNLVYAFVTGTPATWALATVDKTLLTQTVYTNIASITGSLLDGEPTLVGGFRRITHKVVDPTTGSIVYIPENVLFGSVYEPWYNNLSVRNSLVPAFYRNDYTTTSVNSNDAFASYICASPNGNGVDIVARATPLLHYEGIIAGGESSTFTENIIVLENTFYSIVGVGVGNTDNEAYSGGPSIIQGLELFI